MGVFQRRPHQKENIEDDSVVAKHHYLIVLVTFLLLPFVILWSCVRTQSVVYCLIKAREKLQEDSVVVFDFDR